MFQIHQSPHARQPTNLPPASPIQHQRRCLSSASSSASSVSLTNLNHSIQSLCKKGQLKQAIHLLSLEHNPTQHTYELLIQSCAQKRSLSDAFSVRRNITDNGFDQDPFLATKLINMYSELDSIGDARQVFDEITDKTIYVWNALLRALSLSGFGEDVLSLYRKMNLIGICSDRFTYTYALKACVVSENTVSRGKEIHAHIMRHGYGSHLHIMTTLVDIYAKFGYVENANRVFHSMPVKNVVSWSAMIACFAKNGKPVEALDLFHEMMLGSEDMLPNSVTMVSVLQACAALAALEHGKLLHGYVLRKGLDSILPVMSALVTMYSRCGDLGKGARIFSQMSKRDVVAWNSMISSYGIHGFGLEALKTFKDMVLCGVRPTPISFVSVLGACSHSGLIEEGKLLFDSMMKEYGILPSVEHYACMVDLFGRANKFDEATKIIEDMSGDEPGAKVWGSLLGSCRIHCNVELAERASEKLFELEPTNAGNYVLLADIYAEAKMWEEVKRVKKLLDNRGLRKVSGCCWIEVRKKVYSLRSVDELNPQIEQIHALLVNLSMEAREKGYVPETKAVLYDLDTDEKEHILLGHSEKLAVAFGLINCSRGETIRITKNLRLCEDCHSFTKFVSQFSDREIFVRDINRFHHFKNGECSCRDYW